MAIDHYNLFLDSIPTIGAPEFRSFNEKETCFDKFLLKHMNDVEHPALLEVTTGCTQPSVERGFSGNREIVVENQSEENLIAQRIIYDDIKSFGKVKDVPIPPEMMAAARAASTHCNTRLEDNKAGKKAEPLAGKRKRVEEELSNIKRSKTQAEHDIAELHKSADEMALQAELTTTNMKKAMSLIAKSNSFRKTAREKTAVVSQLQSGIEVKQK